MAPKKVFIVLVIDTAIALAAYGLVYRSFWWAWWIAVPITLVMGLLIGTLRSDSTAPQYYPKLKSYGGPPTSTSWYWFAGVGCSGPLTAKQYVGDLMRLGPGYAVSNPGDYDNSGDGFSMELTVRAVVERIKHDRTKQLILIGASQGGSVVFEVIRRVRQLGLVADSNIVAILDCAPSQGRDVKFPAWLAVYVHGRWVSRFYGRVLVPFFIRVSPKQLPDLGVDSDLFELHNQLRNTMDGGAQLGQVASMALVPPVYPGEFKGIKALIVSTRGKDAMIKPTARQRLKLGFPDAELIELDQGHAAQLECPGPRRKAYQDFLRRSLPVPAPGRR